MNDPWWLVLIKVVVLFVVLLVWTIFNVWFERRLVGKMQHRLGPIMNGPLGLGQALADGMKLLIKEDFMPSMVDRVLFTHRPADRRHGGLHGLGSDPVRRCGRHLRR